MTYYEIFFLFIIGIIIGILGGVLGIGGGLIAIPIFNTFFHMNQHIAQGTALIIIIPNVLIGFLIYKKHHNIDIQTTCTLSIFSTISSWISATIVNNIPIQNLQKISATFLTIISIYYILQWINDNYKITKKNIISLSYKFLPFLGIISGFISGILTIGGGLIIVPTLVTLFGLKQNKAQGIALASVAPNAIISLYSYAQHGNVNWNIGLPLALGSTISITFGAELAHKLPEKWIKLTFFIILIGTSFIIL
ncbi:MAG: hypothetical protein DMNBKLKJ_00157 [Candidatus Westeberhardia cardiocondylae]|nr:hypothetical protein [Candidatus Westeberhardia cardiocondylae]